MGAAALNINGHEVEFDGDPRTPLLYVLRNELGLNAAKFGCGLGQCGSRQYCKAGSAAARFYRRAGCTVRPGRRLRDIPFSPERAKAVVAT